jgi:hypothetical protein
MGGMPAWRLNFYADLGELRQSAEILHDGTDERFSTGRLGGSCIATHEAGLRLITVLGHGENPTQVITRMAIPQ